MNKLTILLIEDSFLLADDYMEYLQPEKANITHVATGKLAIAYLTDHSPQVILLDIKLSDGDGMEILKYIADRGMDCCVIIISAQGAVDQVVEAMRLGAFEFLPKPIDKIRLQNTVRNAMERMYLHQMVDTCRSKYGRNKFHGMLGSSQNMQAVYDTIDIVAPSTATVFITGESGTGKELCAQALHDRSTNKDQELVILNCGDIPKDLMECEIFGHVKGAFTGAISDREGAAQRADGGTLFLDEIGEMDIELQAKLLRLIQSGTFQHVGSTDTLSVNIRYICATNRNPLEMVEQGLLREDLYYRLNVIPIKLPALRERGRDMLEIAKNF